ncbi:hypothetical protein AX15_001183 [Amanita polypyramis BW_CC]|nr:hypothetical protein AX15_001183 [Amanita polypyramis BW_CC]
MGPKLWQRVCMHTLNEDARALAETSPFRMTMASSMLAEKGFTCLQVDLSPPTAYETLPVDKVMAHFESGLRFAVRSAVVPFAPIVIARSAGCIIGQAYISSNPATGLFLVSPPSSTEAVSRTLLSAPLDEFNFEARFPIAVMATHAEMDKLKKFNRLCNDPAIDMIETSEMDDRTLLVNLECWLEDLGV